MSGGGGAKKPTAEELAAAQAAKMQAMNPVNPVNVPPVLMPQQNALLAQQMQQGGYGNANQIRGLLNAQYQDPNQGNEWFYKIINAKKPDATKKPVIGEQREGEIY